MDTTKVGIAVSDEAVKKGEESLKKKPEVIKKTKKKEDKDAEQKPD